MIPINLSTSPRTLDLSVKTACLIPTYNGETDLPKLLDSIQNQTLVVSVFIADSSSTDRTVQIAKERGVEITPISKDLFNHGGTRQLLADRYQGYDVFVYLTQDAYLADPSSLERMLAYFDDPEVGAVCGRQLPHLDARPLARHARLFNYPEGSLTKTLEDAPRLGIKTAFMSNSFAAYRAAALKKVGGFPSNVILSEDMYVAAKMLMGDWKIVYSGEAKCYHSHNYTIAEEARRYFDIGVFHARESWIRKTFGGAGGEGLRFVRSELSFLGARSWFLWPSSLLRNAVKLFAYKLGQKEKHLPLALKKHLGMNKGFWRAT